MNRTEFAKEFLKMAIAYPSVKLSDGAVEVYFEVLSSLPDEVIRASALQARADCKFFPSAAEWYQAGKLILAASQPPAKLPTEAWDEVLRMNNRLCDGPCPGVEKFSSEAVWRAARGLWSRLSGSTATYDENALGFIQRDFIESYKGAVVQAQNDERLLPASTETARRITEGVVAVTARLGAGR